MGCSGLMYDALISTTAEVLLLLVSYCLLLEWLEDPVYWHPGLALVCPRFYASPLSRSGSASAIFTLCRFWYRAQTVFDVSYRG
jgi:hypothetical protein